MRILSYSVLKTRQQTLVFLSIEFSNLSNLHTIFSICLNPIKFIISNGPFLNILRDQLTLFEKSILEYEEGKCRYKWFWEICNIFLIVCKYFVNIETIKYYRKYTHSYIIPNSQFWVSMSGFMYVYFLVFLSVICFGFIFVLVDIIFCQVFPIIFDLFCISKLSK